MAYTFLTPEDVTTLIKDDMLGHIINSDEDILFKAEKIAVSQMRDSLRSRFDVDAIFSAEADERHHLVLMYTIDIMLYHVHSRINPRRIPALRIERYKEAKEWLKQILNGDLTPELPPILNEDGDEELGKNKVRHGGGINKTDPWY
jgi:hypothetical protein